MRLDVQNSPFFQALGRECTCRPRIWHYRGGEGVLMVVHVDDIGRVFLPLKARNWLGVRKGDSLHVKLLPTGGIELQPCISEESTQDDGLQPPHRDPWEEH